MVLSYITSSWNSLRSRKTPSELSHRLRNDNAPQPEGTPDAQSDTFINESAAAVHDTNMKASEHGTEQPYNDLTPHSGSKSKRKERQKKRKRRPSLDTSLFSPESESGDIASIPYRADEQAERNAFLADKDNDHNHNESEIRDKEDAGINGGTVQDTSTVDASSSGPNDIGSAVDNEHRKSANESMNSTATTEGRRSLKLVENGIRNKYPCPGAEQYDCQRMFAMLSSAKRHMKNVHLKETFSCPTCDKVYTRADILQRHRLTHTAEEVTAASPPRELQIDEDVSDGEEISAVLVESDLQVQLDNPTRSSNSGFTSINNGIASRSNHENSSNATAAVESLTSVTEQPVTLQVEGQTPKSRSELKRKRRSAELLIPNTVGQASKRQKKSLLSTQTAELSEHTSHEPDSGRVNGSNSKPSKVIGSNGSKTGNLDGFAKPWAPGSQLYHPVLNPRSPRKTSAEVQVVIPESSRARSVRQNVWKELETTSQETPLAGKTRKSAIYSSAKGKQRAEPDVDYSSPTHLHKQNITANIAENEPVTQGQERAGMATTIAKKTSAHNSIKSPVVSGQGTEDTMNDSESQFTSEDGSMSEGASQSGDMYLCQECHRKFPSRALLQKHERRKDVHKLVVPCEVCNTTFRSREMLKKHQQGLGHGDGTGFSGRKGPFSAAEINKLCRWRDRFCREYDINHVDFNNMMTDSLRRHKGFVWPYRFISKADFLQEYYDILPGRNRRSMHRYRERAFQNVTSSLEWTQEEDQELADLYKEIGPKWVEIGQRMSRTSDSVNQRWRNKLQYRGKQNDGEWLKAETEQLKDAVDQVKRESGISFDPNADIKMPWDSVSKKMKGRRTAQQCSNKWRLMHVVRKNGVFLKSDGDASSRSNSGTPLPVTTPSKMSRRLAGATPSNASSQVKFGRRPVSDVYVHESDDEVPDDHDHTGAVLEKGLQARLGTDPAREPGLQSQGDDIENSSDSSSSAAGPVEESTAEDAKEDVDKLPQADSETESPLDESVGNHDESSRSETSDEESEEVPDNSSISADNAEAQSSAGNDTNDVVNEIPSDLAASNRLQHDSEASQSSQSHISEADTDDSSERLPSNPLPARTPRNNPSISQAFNQTQANTSAVRAPRGDRQTQSQPVRPSPDVAIQMRPMTTSPQQPVYQSSQYNDHDASSDGSASDEEGSASNSSSENTDNDTMVEDTRRESFLQSLRSQLSQRNQLVVPRSSQTPKKRVDWAKALSGQAHADEESSSSSDED